MYEKTRKVERNLKWGDISGLNKWSLRLLSNYQGGNMPVSSASKVRYSHIVSHYLIGRVMVMKGNV